MEDLSELLEEPIDPEKIAELRQKMTDKTVCSCHLMTKYLTKPCDLGIRPEAQ